jgi:hypothetical protein
VEVVDIQPALLLPVDQVEAAAQAEVRLVWVEPGLPAKATRAETKRTPGTRTLLAAVVARVQPVATRPQTTSPETEATEHRAASLAAP